MAYSSRHLKLNFDIVLLSAIGLALSFSVNGNRVKREDVEEIRASTEAPPTESTTVDGLERVPSTTPTSFIEEALNVHNYFRNLHHVPDLVLNTTLNEVSQAYADKLVAAGSDHFEHNAAAIKAELGENMYYYKTTNEGNQPNATKAITAWYNEINNYDFQTGDPIKGSGEILHFTQIVWKSTTQMGIAYARTPKSAVDGYYTTFIIANYFPRANWDSFTENVIPISEVKGAGNTVKPGGCFVAGHAAILALILSYVV